MPKLIPNEALTAADVPPGFEDWVRFASTFDGYQEFGDRCAEIANTGNPQTLSEYRACLFFEWRRWRHFGSEPDGEARAHIMGLLEGIREIVAKKEGK